MWAIDCCFRLPASKVRQASIVPESRILLFISNRSFFCWMGDEEKCKLGIVLGSERQHDTVSPSVHQNQPLFRGGWLERELSCRTNLNATGACYTTGGSYISMSSNPVLRFMLPKNWNVVVPTGFLARKDNYAGDVLLAVCQKAGNIPYTYEPHAL